MSFLMPETSFERVPQWVQKIKDSYMAASASQFLLHGIRDRFPYGHGYLPLASFLHHTFCADKATVIYDISQGFSFPRPEDEAQFRAFIGVLRARQNIVVSDEELIKPSQAIPLLQEFLFGRNNVAVIVDYVEKIAPRDEIRFMSYDERRIVTMLRRWADDPRLSRRNSFVFLITESLVDVSEELYVRSSQTEVIEVPLPNPEERKNFIEQEISGLGERAPKLEMSSAVLADITNGLSRSQIGAMMRGAVQQEKAVDFNLASAWKRRAIETEIGDLVEFTQPRFGLEALAGVDKQKKILLRTAEALRSGQSSIVPKGILLTGPPGTGKTFCMECFAHDCGLPFVQLRNVFSKYVGATESNLEKLFYHLEALSPVFVFIDEFDQSYGRRVTNDNDSGVSRRVFGMFNNFLSDERHQGKILFGAATNRPDLIDASTLRAGRFDLKLPFLLPDESAREAILKVSLKSLKLNHEITDFSKAIQTTEGYSGADLKELIRVAERNCIFSCRTKINNSDLDYAVSDYIPPTVGNADEIRLMELLSVTACTSRALLHEKYVKSIEDGSVQRELEHLKMRIG